MSSWFDRAVLCFASQLQLHHHNCHVHLSMPASPSPPAGDQLRLFQSVIPVFRFDIPTSLFLMPYLVRGCGQWMQWLVLVLPTSVRHSRRLQVDTLPFELANSAADIC